MRRDQFSMKELIPARACLLAALFLLACQAESAGPTAIRGATIIDGSGARPIADGIILIEDGRISAVGTSAQVDLPAGADVIDARGKFIIPGLMDANVHLSPKRDFETLIGFEGRYREIVVEAAQIALKNGLTTVFDTWGARAALVQARDMINAREVPGSRIYLAGNIIGFGGPFSSDFHEVEGANVSKAFIRQINEAWEQGTGQHLLWANPETVRRAVRDYIALDVDFLKYAASGHELLEMRFISFSPRVQKIIVEEGHRANLIVQAHTSTNESLDLAIEAGVDILTHCDVSGPDTPLAEETIAKIAERGTPCSAIPITQRRLDALLEADPDHWLPQYISTMKDNQSRMIAAGVTLLVSTDAGLVNPVLAAEATGVDAVEVDPHATLGEGHFNALVALQELGMAPMEILKAVTSNTARAYRRDSDLGTLEVGKRADLLILDRNPLQDAANYRRINSVIKDGEVIDVDALPLAPLIGSMAR